jgi:hypothetical protein
MDVKKLDNSRKSGAGPAVEIDGRRRRALARLGLATPGAYVTPTLLSLQSTVISGLSGAEIGVAA